MERELLDHPLVQEVAVIGVSDLSIGFNINNNNQTSQNNQNNMATQTYGLGERVTALLVATTTQTGPGKSSTESPLTLEQVREFLRPRLAPYKLPTSIRWMPSLPRNHMGKLNKKELLKGFNK